MLYAIEKFFGDPKKYFKKLMTKELQKEEICDKIFLNQKYFSHNGENSPPKKITTLTYRITLV
jgi:hypothetical protein